jgi:aryl carrier-like protein
MVPFIYIPIKQMPVTISGKRDRMILQQLLQQLDSSQLTQYALGSIEKRPPSTDMEKKLQNLWGAVLNLEANSVGLDDHFFRLGGDSIGAMRLVSTARVEGISLTVADIFHNPRLCKMASVALLSNNDAGTTLKPFAMLKSTHTISLDELSCTYCQAKWCLC